MPAPYRRLGRITKVHGTQGEVWIAPREDLSSSFLTSHPVWIVPPATSGATARSITDVRPGPKGWLIRIGGIADAAQAHEVVGRYLLAAGDEPPAEGADELIGLDVHDAERGYIGTVTEVIETGANDVLVLHDGPFGEVLVPVIETVIAEIDEDAGTLHVTLLPGLIDEDADES
jgi:16S rRNA processing protein RimM